MSATDKQAVLEQQIGQWRAYLRNRQAIQTVDVEELEDHLREQVAGFVASGLEADEAFLVAVKRLGDLDTLSREFAREHSERLWKQLVVVPDDLGEGAVRARTEGLVAFGLATLAGALVKLPGFLGVGFDGNDVFYVRNASLFVLPVLAAFFAWKRDLDAGALRWLALAFVAAAVVANVYPFVGESHTLILLALHLPIALWMVVGVAYSGGRWGQVEGRMDFIRFSGELFIYFVLIALGGGVLTGFTAMMFESVGIDIEPYIEQWMPSLVAGAVLVAAWLVEAKQSVIENMAPVLTRLFTPLFALALLVFLVTLVVTGRGIDIERDVLIAFDLLLAVVVALLLYSVSARDPLTPAGPFDVVQLVLVLAALVVDVVLLGAIASRITEFGFTPNRVAALGENVILLANLTGAGVLHTRFLRGRGTFARLEKWQTDFLPVYAGWAAVVAVGFPLVFGFGG